MKPTSTIRVYNIGGNRSFPSVREFRSRIATGWGAAAAAASKTSILSCRGGGGHHIVILNAHVASVVEKFFFFFYFCWINRTIFIFRWLCTPPPQPLQPAAVGARTHERCSRRATRRCVQLPNSRIILHILAMRWYNIIMF